jgi:cation transport regulator
MPYKSNRELPQDVREGLPEEAQDTYRDAYNQACDPGEPSERHDPEASKAGWSAVERDYKWQNEQWVRRNQDDEARGLKAGGEGESFRGKGGPEPTRDPRTDQTQQQPPREAPPHGAANKQREGHSGTLRKGISGEEEEEMEQQADSAQMPDPQGCPPDEDE